MPIYAYVCKKCDHELDALQKMADAPLTECPACGEAELRRRLSAPRFRLKGKGWYETDFKKDNQRNIAGDKEPAKAEASKSEGSKSETPKSDSKSEAKVSPAKKSTTE